MLRVQAKNIAKRLPESKREEIFIAALLLHVGEMAFFGVGGHQIEQFEQAIENTDESLHSVCLDVLGVGFKTISKELAKEWEIGELLIKCLNATKASTPDVNAVLIGDAIARNVHLGIHSKTMQKLVISVAKLNSCSEKEAQDIIMANADEAAQVAATYGASRVCHLIPDSATLEKGLPQLSPTDFQLKALHQLMEFASNGEKDLNRVFAIVNKGMFKGVGFSRSVIALLDQTHNAFEARYVEGEKEWTDRFRMPLNSSNHNQDIFSWVQAHKGR